MNAAGKTHKGRIRDNNEDAIFVSNSTVSSLPNLYIVADGMGGHSGGEVASHEAIQFFLEYAVEHSFTKQEIMDHMISGVRYANRNVYQMAFDTVGLEGMGTTFTACSVDEEEQKIYITHIGDSRAYLCGDTLEQLTTDHSYVEAMVKMGQLTKEEASRHPKKNLLTRALGTDEEVEVDGYVRDIIQPSTVLLCSDGLINMVSEEDIYKVLKEDASNENKCIRLIELANANGGIDNISVIVFDVRR